MQLVSNLRGARCCTNLRPTPPTSHDFVDCNTSMSSLGAGCEVRRSSYQRVAMHTSSAVMAWASILCSIRLEPSQAFVPSPTGRDGSMIVKVFDHGWRNINSTPQPSRQLTSSPRSLKRPRPRPQAASAGEEGEWEVRAESLSHSVGVSQCGRKKQPCRSILQGSVS